MANKHDDSAPDAIADYLNEVPGLSGARCVRQLADGPVSDSWLLESAGKRVVLRVDRPLAKWLGLNRAAEVDILLQVEQAGLGPAPLWSAPGDGVLLTTYVNGAVLQRAQILRADVLGNVADRLRDLHSLQINAPYLDPNEVAGRYADRAASEQAAELARQVYVLTDELQYGVEQRCICHNDLGHQNIVAGDSLAFIDWEYAAITDPWFDLAGVVVQNELSDELMAVFLRSYAGKSATAGRRRLRSYVSLYRLIGSLWQMVVTSDRLANG